MNEDSRPHAAPRAVVLNAVTMNGGDAAILIAIIEQIRLVLGVEARVTVLDLVGTAAERYYPDLELEPSTVLMGGGHEAFVTRRARALSRLLVASAATLALRAKARHDWVLAAAPAWLRRRISLFKEADVVVATGGTYLVEHYRLLPKLFDIFLANALGRPVVLFTQSLGPFTRPQSRRLIRAALGPARLILLRDQRSLEHLKEIGLDTTRCVVRADTVFALGDTERVHAAATERLPATGRRVAISVRSWASFHTDTPDAGMRRYRDAVAALCRHLVDRDQAAITFVSTCQGIEEYEAKDDRVAQSIVDSLPQTYRERIVVDKSFHDPRALLERLSSFDLVVSTRMHMAILALIAGRPVLPIAYEFKTKELFARLGFSQWLVDIDTVDASSLCDTYNRICAEVDTLRPALARGVLECIDEARSVTELFKRAIG